MELIFNNKEKEEALNKQKLRLANDVLNSEIIECLDDVTEPNWYLYTIRERSEFNEGPVYVGISMNPLARWKDHFRRRPHPQGLHGCGYFFRLDETLVMNVEVNLGPITKREAMRFEANYKDHYELDRGEVYMRKLTLDDAEQIRQKYKEGSSVPELAAEYELTRKAIWGIINGDTYRY